MQLNSSVLTIDGQPIIAPQVFAYLQSCGRLQGFVTEILRQHVIAQEFKTRQELTIDPFLVEQALVNFRVENKLTDPQDFQQWSAKNPSAYAGFRNETIYQLKIDKLKELVAKPKLQEYFIERKLFLDRVVLSQIAVADRELAEELRSQIMENSDSFEQLAREHSLTEDRIANGMMGPLSRGRLKESLRAAIDCASPGEIIGPIDMEKHYCLFRVEQFLPATLAGELEKQLLNEIFDRWLGQKMQKMTVKLQEN